MVHSIADGKLLMPPLPAFGVQFGYFGLQFSGDGRCLGQNTDKAFRYWQLDGAEPVELFREVRPRRASALRPDSRQVALLLADGTISLCSAADGREEKVLPPNGKPAGGWSRLMYHPSRLDRLLVKGPNLIAVLDLSTGQRLLEVPVAGDNSVEWHPGGKRFAALVNREVLIFDAETGRRLLAFNPANGRGAAPPFAGLGDGGEVRFNHAGDLLAGTDWDGTLSLWDARSGHLLLQTPRNMIQTELWFSPDDTLLAGDVTSSGIRLLRIDPGRECGRIGVYSFSGKGLAVTGDGRLAALNVQDGAALIDLHYREQVARLPGHGGGRFQPLRFLPDGSLLAGGNRGVFRWPVERTAGGFRFGQPHDCSGGDGQDQWESLGWTTWGSSADGQVVASPDYSRGARILHQQQPPQVIHAGPQHDVRHCDVSPDGTLVAAGSHFIGSVAVWDARRGTLVKQLAAGGGAVRFSPDGRWLALHLHIGQRCEVWRVGDWQRQWSLEGGFLRPAFTPDGRLLALSKADEPGYVRLVRPESGTEVVRLFTADHTRASPLGFTPDGGRLCALGENNLLYVWDLTLIRQQLRDLALDWDDEPLPPPCPAAREPLAVEVAAGEEVRAPEKKSR
jgi:WD40 repeat protein